MIFTILRLKPSRDSNILLLIRPKLPSIFLLPQLPRWDGSHSIDAWLLQSVCNTPSVLRGGAAYILSEDPGKVGRRGEAGPERNDGDTERRIAQQLTGLPAPHPVVVFQEGHPGLGMKDPCEIILVDIKPVRDLVQREFVGVVFFQIGGCPIRESFF